MKYLIIKNGEPIFCNSVDELFSIKKEYPESKSYALIEIDDILEDSES